ncbi:polysaccharide deacetylase family protein [Clostridium uliginosum]|uniref:Peptidoglycan/xylan/chitin deacetylase, PgdA/CDA1 family n=1 Tax=Clostridium uliginosum TaxID=119641 RepID=A0A1I1J266_9CLOT|nr:polysaccharide deacetylase family protein [Clostridium uliginosum]SFC42485.1 Peptidoglycan/xylan/chitin deacetylase, PgdA/CDA1 family [Clostridium uliginosum]
MLNNINKLFTKKSFLITLICILICSFGAYLIYNKVTSNSTIKDKIQNENSQTLDKPKDTTNNTVEDKSSPKEEVVKEIPMINENIGVPVLYYHSVKETEDNEVTISPQKLRNELRYIKDSGYTTLTMAELQNHLLNNTAIPEKSIVITFDDGYMNNYTNAFSILKDLDMKATIFCITFKLDGQYYLSESAIKNMSDYGIDIESHTAGHPDLTKMTYEQQLSEFVESKEALESITDKPVTAVAYPYGNYNDDSIRAAKDAGFALAFTTHLGLADRNDNPFSLDRIYISSSYDMDTFKNLLANTKK